MGWSDRNRPFHLITARRLGAWFGSIELHAGAGVGRLGSVTATDPAGGEVMAQEWYVQIGEKVFGPHPPAKLREGAKTGRLLPEMLVRRGEEGPWIEASRIQGLFSSSRSDHTSRAESAHADGWYYQVMGETFGPLATEELMELSRNETLTRETNVKHVENGADRGWAAAGSLPGFDVYFSDPWVGGAGDSGSARGYQPFYAGHGLWLWCGGIFLGFAGLVALTRLQTLLAAPFLFSAAFLVLPPGWSFTFGRWPAVLGSGPQLRWGSVLLAFLIFGTLNPRDDVTLAGKPKPARTQDVQEPETDPWATVSQKPVAIQPTPRFEYTVINQEVLLGHKRTLDIRLDKGVSEDVLRSIALELRASDPKGYKRTFICYYLPGMQVDAGAWATTHFNPDLKVQVLGRTAGKLAGSPETQRSNDLPTGVIGRWLDTRPFMGGIALFRENEKLILETSFIDGSKHRKNVVEKPSPTGRRFDPVIDTSGTGDHYILDASGSLQIRDIQGLIAIAKKLK